MDRGLTNRVSVFSSSNIKATLEGETNQIFDLASTVLICPLDHGNWYFFEKRFFLENSQEGSFEK